MEKPGIDIFCFCGGGAAAKTKNIPCLRKRSERKSYNGALPALNRKIISIKYVPVLSYLHSTHKFIIDLNQLNKFWKKIPQELKPSATAFSA